MEGETVTLLVLNPSFGIGDEATMRRIFSGSIGRVLSITGRSAGGLEIELRPRTDVKQVISIVSGLLHRGERLRIAVKESELGRTQSSSPASRKTEASSSLKNPSKILEAGRASARNGRNVEVPDAPGKIAVSSDLAKLYQKSAQSSEPASAVPNWAAEYSESWVDSEDRMDQKRPSPGSPDSEDGLEMESSDEENTIEEAQVAREHDSARRLFETMYGAEEDSNHTGSPESIVNFTTSQDMVVHPKRANHARGAPTKGFASSVSQIPLGRPKFVDSIAAQPIVEKVVKKPANKDAEMTKALRKALKLKYRAKYEKKKALLKKLKKKLSSHSVAVSVPRNAPLVMARPTEIIWPEQLRYEPGASLETLRSLAPVEPSTIVTQSENVETPSTQVAVPTSLSSVLAPRSLRSFFPGAADEAVDTGSVFRLGGFAAVECPENRQIQSAPTKQQSTAPTTKVMIPKGTEVHPSVQIAPAVRKNKPDQLWSNDSAGTAANDFFRKESLEEAEMEFKTQKRVNWRGRKYVK